MLRVVAVAIGVSFFGCSCAADRAATASYNPETRLMAPVAQGTNEGPGLAIEIEDVTVDDLGPVKKKFDERVRAGDKDIVFRIDSSGGSIGAGNDFIQYVGDQKKKNGLQIRCIVDTKAYSMGFVFLQSFCDERLMTKRSTLLAHSGRTRTAGTVEEIESDAAFLRALNESMAVTCAERMGMPIEEYRAKTAGSRDWTMAYRDAVDAHAVDGLISAADMPPPYTLDAPAPDDFLRLLLGGSK